MMTNEQNTTYALDYVNEVKPMNPELLDRL